MIKKTLKFFLVDFPVNILGDLFEQTLIMQVFIVWGWLCILIMLTSLGQSVAVLM
ncbi:MAG: hypothetical protein QGD92_02995 [Gammaproteobacteria bacterium]|nr:hypothetical protein [Gammaproteobacteria bacterium]